MTTSTSPVDWRVPRADRSRPRILLGLVLLAAAMPQRVPVSVPFIASVSVLDVLLMVATVTLLLDLPFRRLAIGYPEVLLALAVPVVASLASVSWSQDHAASVNVAAFTLEALLAYLFATRELEGLPSRRVVALLERFTVLLIVPAVLLLLHVPGFAPQQAGLKANSGDYLSFYTRLSHPILGRSNNLATVLVVFVPVLLWYGHTRRRWQSTAAGLLGVAAIAATQSRGVVLSSLVALVVLLAVRPRSTRRGRPVLPKVVAAVSAVAVLAVAYYALNPDTKEFESGRLSPENVFLRQALLRDAFGHVLAHPLLGFGPGVVPDNDPALTVDVHNTYLQQLLSFGVPLGALVGLSLVALPVWFLTRGRRSPAALVVGYALTVEMLSFCFESSFEGTVLRVLFFFSVGLLTSFVRAVEDEPDPSAAVVGATPAGRVAAASATWFGAGR